MFPPALRSDPKPSGTVDRSIAPMTILVTGNLGYLGPVVCTRLKSAYPGVVLHGLDTGYFAGCLVDTVRAPESLVDIQHAADLRRIPADVLDRVDIVVHLGGISNDPMGKQFESVTKDINLNSTV